ncbi:MAG: RnfABCDGE type electron transport complex subunit D [Candidatus Geothermincolia bacterium]
MPEEADATDAPAAEVAEPKKEPAPKDMLVIGASPHIRARETTAGIMGWVVVAALPVTVYGIYIGGWNAFIVVAMCLIGTVGTEAIVQRLRHMPVTVFDMSAVVTGLLLALTLPPRLPFWMPLIGGIVAMLLGKHVFGGLGHNIFNPALVGRAVLFVSWAKYMTTSYLVHPQAAVVNTATIRGINAITKATPLVAVSQARKGTLAITASQYVKPLFFGNPWGQIGEVSALMILIGFAILLIKGLIDWRVPVVFVATVAIISWALGVNPLFAILSGGLLFGAVFMATDYVTNPMTAWGKVVFALGCGVITVVLRFYSNLPEGVMFAILIMNGITPVIDRYIRPRVYGHKRGSKEEEKEQGEAEAA